jgi:hypothetical protein
MTRIPTHTLQDAPEASRPILEVIVAFSPTGNVLNLHAQLAHSPAVLAAYAAIRQATTKHGTLDPKVRSALMLATAGVCHNGYTRDLTTLLGVRAGWSREQAAALLAGQSSGDSVTDALAGVVREAASRSGEVCDLTWQHAEASGWSSEQIAEAFVYLGLTVYTAYFLNYARTPGDLPAGQEPATAGAGARG